jgi:hypothetical protein
MVLPGISRYRLLFGLLVFTTLLTTTVRAQTAGFVRGRVLDPLGRAVFQAKVILLQDGKEVAQGTSDAEGSFDLAAPGSGAFRLRRPGLPARRLLPYS